MTQSRSYLPDAVGALTWIAPYAPHHSSFVPVYASAPTTPSSLNTGTQCTYTTLCYVRTAVNDLNINKRSFCPVDSCSYWSIYSFYFLFIYFPDKFDKDANWWIHCLTSNYLSRWYTYTIRAVMDHQREIEQDLFTKQIEIELHAVTLTQAHGR